MDLCALQNCGALFGRRRGWIYVQYAGVNFSEDQWASLRIVEAIRNEATEGQVNGAEAEVDLPSNSDVLEKRDNAAERYGEAAGSVEEAEQTPIVPTYESEAPNTHVASMQEVKHLSHKRSRAANRLKYPATAPFDDVADYFSRCTTILYSNDSRELTGDSLKPCALALSTEKEMKFVDGVALR